MLHMRNSNALLLIIYYHEIQDGLLEKLLFMLGIGGLEKMETKYIGKQVAIDALHEAYEARNPTQNAIMDKATMVIFRLPPADVRPVVTCAECDWHVDCGYHFCNKWCQPCPDNADFYCAYGERPTAGLT